MADFKIEVREAFEKKYLKVFLRDISLNSKIKGILENPSRPRLQRGRIYHYICNAFISKRKHQRNNQQAYQQGYNSQRKTSLNDPSLSNGLGMVD